MNLQDLKKVATASELTLIEAVEDLLTEDIRKDLRKDLSQSVNELFKARQSSHMTHYEQMEVRRLLQSLMQAISGEP